MKEIKVRVLDKCAYCSGQAYLPDREVTDTDGRTFMRYQACPICKGDGVVGRWATLPEFQKLLEQGLCSHEHISQSGGLHFSGGECWDNIEEYCTDCGKPLD